MTQKKSLLRQPHHFIPHKTWDQPQTNSPNAKKIVGNYEPVVISLTFPRFFVRVSVDCPLLMRTYPPEVEEMISCERKWERELYFIISCLLVCSNVEVWARNYINPLFCFIILGDRLFILIHHIVLAIELLNVRSELTVTPRNFGFCKLVQ